MHLPEQALAVAMGIVEEHRGRFGAESMKRVEQLLQSMVERGFLPVDEGYRRAHYLFPLARNCAWHEPAWYPTLEPVFAAFRAAHAEIKAEVKGAIAAFNEFGQYKHLSVSVEEWRTATFVAHGKWRPRAFSRFPVTAKLVQLLLERDLVGGEVHLSFIAGGAHVPAHTDPTNTAINAHFPVIIPQGCSLRVADETRSWREGEPLLFDYTYEHEVWNRSDQVRVCLLADLWNPEITPAERSALTALQGPFGAVRDESLASYKELAALPSEG